jgi:hypothetical protein
MVLFDQQNYKIQDLKMKTKFLRLAIILLSLFNNCIKGQETQGFFLDNFKPKIAVIPQSEEMQKPGVKPSVVVTIDFKDTIAKVSDYLFGNNSNTFMTQIVDQPKLIKYISDLSPNIIRFPGGNLSNTYFWNAEKGKRPVDVSDSVFIDKILKPAEYWYGRNQDSSTLSLNNYYLMLKKTNSTGIICVNYGYARYGTGPNPVQAAAHLAADWVRFDNGRTKYWEIGNENFAPWEAGFIIDTIMNKDHQPRTMSGVLYGKHFKVFADSMRAAAQEIGANIKIGTVTVEIDKGKSWYNQIEANWNEEVFRTIGNYADFFDIHSYFTPYNENSTPATILNSALKECIDMMGYMKKMSGDFGIKLKPIALTEWNIFAVKSKQSSSFISGIHAALVLGELAKNKFGEACRWDLVNRYDNGNDHGMFNFGDEPGVPRWNPRPVYFYMYYFQKLFGDHVVSSSVIENNDIVCYASRFGSGQAGIVIVNKGTKDEVVKLDISNFAYGKRYYLYSLTGGNDNGQFSQCVFVNGHGPDNMTGGPINNLENIKAFSAQINNEIKFISPAYSVQYVLIENK